MVPIYEIKAIGDGDDESGQKEEYNWRIGIKETT